MTAQPASPYAAPTHPPTDLDPVNHARWHLGRAVALFKAAHPAAVTETHLAVLHVALCDPPAPRTSAVHSPVETVLGYVLALEDGDVMRRWLWAACRSYDLNPDLIEGATHHG